MINEISVKEQLLTPLNIQFLSPSIVFFLKFLWVNLFLFSLGSLFYSLYLCSICESTIFKFKLLVKASSDQLTLDPRVHTYKGICAFYFILALNISWIFEVTSMSLSKITRQIIIRVNILIISVWNINNVKVYRNPPATLHLPWTQTQNKRP